MARFSKSHFADADLVRGLLAAHAAERGCLAESLAFLAEFQARRLYVRTEYPDLREYCMRVLHLSESAAYKRLRAIRAAHRFPQIYDALADGRLHLSAVVSLEPHLTPDNVDELIAASTHQTRENVDRLIAERWPHPDVPTALWSVGSPHVPVPLSPGTVAAANPRVPAPVVVPESRTAHEASLAAAATPPPAPPAPCASTATPLAPAPPARITPLAPQRFAFQCTLDEDTLELLRRAQVLLGHTIPSGETVQVLKRVLTDWVRAAECRQYGLTEKPRAGVRRATGARRIPAAIKRAVMRRDGGRCTFVAANGRRCESCTRLEFDHVQPLARGGLTTAANLRLRCRAHNQLEAERTFGAAFMAARRAHAASRARTEVRGGSPT